MTPLWTPIRAEQDIAAPPEAFPSPFDELGPHPLARLAAGLLKAELEAGLLDDVLTAASLQEPGGGKMFGVLVARAPDGSLGFLRAFSGTLAGRFDVPGFVQPIFDIDARAAVEVEGERVVTRLTARAAAFAASPEVAQARAEAAAMAVRHREESAALRAMHVINRRRRREQRSRLGLSASTPAAAENEHAPQEHVLHEHASHEHASHEHVLHEHALHEHALHELAQQSRRDKAERRRLDETHAAERAERDKQQRRILGRVAAHARLHRMVSRSLMRMIHDTYRVASARGEVRGLRSLYAPAESPGGAGDCAAPKLLASAFAQGLRPVAMAEFWWGAPPAAGGRVHGEFYPACRDKCGPLLPFLLDGMNVAATRRFELPDAAALDLRVVFEDEWIVVVDKPCGLLSVPLRGADGGDSVLVRLQSRCAGTGGALLVHRLDLDTSGLLVAARDAKTHAALQRQFLRRTVRKRYVAVVEGVIRTGAGTIELPMRVDVTDRPRQVHDPVHGKPAASEWQVLAHEAGGRTRIAWFPLTGRTHQLRVHAAHPLGLGAPIVGDRLYGHAGGRLMLHAESLSFVHPASGKLVTFESPTPF